MKAIDKLIFNLLATHRGCSLPGLGSLYVERRPAQRVGRNRVEAPQNRVVFSGRERPECETLPRSIARQAGIGSEEAERLYEVWFEQARHEKSVVIEGVGEIRQNFFTPSEELNALLNPAGTSCVTIKRRIRTGRIVLFCAGIAVCAGIVSFFLFGDPLPRQGQALKDKKIETSPARPTEKPAAPVTDSVSASETAPQDSISKPSRTSDTTPAISELSPELYYVVAGVYSTEENADTFIAKAQNRDGSLVFSKVRMRNGKIMVCLFSSADQQEAERERRRLSAKNRDLWIYKRKG